MNIQYLLMVAALGYVCGKFLGLTPLSLAVFTAGWVVITMMRKR